jgi:hypothetical protein
LIKEPIPTLIFIFLALSLAIRNAYKKKPGESRIKRMLDYIGTNLGEFSLASFIVLYWGYSMRSPLNIGLRHVLLTLPLMYILAAVVLKKWVARISVTKYLFIIALACWLILETLFAAPHFLSYFNEFGGGTSGGYHFVTDSNYDWGQDLWRLQSFVVAHPEIEKIAVDYFGGGSPKYYLGAKEVNWAPSKGNPADQGIHWLAVSVNQLEGAIQPVAPDKTRNASDTYSWLVEARPIATSSETLFGGAMGNVPPPDYRAGTSMFIYKL